MSIFWAYRFESCRGHFNLSSAKYHNEQMAFFTFVYLVGYYPHSGYDLDMEVRRGRVVE